MTSKPSSSHPSHAASRLRRADAGASHSHASLRGPWRSMLPDHSIIKREPRGARDGTRPTSAARRSNRPRVRGPRGDSRGIGHGASRRVPGRPGRDDEGAGVVRVERAGAIRRIGCRLHVRRAQILLVLTKTDPSAQPPHRGISAFVVEKGAPGLTVGRDIDKMGYKTVETCELHFERFPVPAAHLIGGEEGHGFKQVMTGLEAERLNIAARGLGVARAAFEEAIKYAQQRRTFGKPIASHQSIQIKLAQMGTRIEASRLLIYSAAAKKDRQERCDLEAGMAKLFATETAAEVSLEAMRILGGNGFSKDFPIERFYRDAPLLVIGGGTNELQRLIIARQLLQKYAIP